MAKKFNISLTENPDAIDLQMIREDPEGHNDIQSPPVDWLPISAIMRNPNGEMVAGLIGGSYWGWLYIAHIWVKDRRRRKSYCLRLMKEVEKEALRRGCDHCYLETQNFESMLFYEGLGYLVVRKTEESGYTRYAMQKELYSNTWTSRDD